MILTLIKSIYSTPQRESNVLISNEASFHFDSSINDAMRIRLQRVTIYCGFLDASIISNFENLTGQGKLASSPYYRGMMNQFLMPKLKLLHELFLGGVISHFDA